MKDPATNIMMGTWYLSELRREFGGNFVPVLADYNAGRGRVREWLEVDGFDPGEPKTDCTLRSWPGASLDEQYPVAKIRLSEAWRYVLDVIASLRKYRELYE